MSCPDFFSLYYTSKNLQIRNPCLSGTYYLLVSIILLYSCWIIIWNKAYLEYDREPVGSMRMRLRDPVNGFLKEPKELSYCSEINTGCRQFDSYEIVYPPTQEDGLFVTTYVEDDYEEKSKKDDSWDDKERKSYFTIQPEDFYIRLRHIVATTYALGTDNHFNYYSYGNQDMIGYLLNHIYGSPPLQNLEKEIETDDLAINTILEACGFQLEDKSGAHDHENETLRMRGAVIFVTIVYTNIGDFLGTKDLYYKIHVKRIPEADYKVNEVIQNGPHERIIRRRYGLQIKFFQNFKIAQISLPAIALQFASSLGLLQIATIFVDFLGYCCLRGKKSFEKIKYPPYEYGSGIYQKKKEIKNKKEN